MDTISLKKYIYENNKIQFVLKEIGSHDIQYHQSKEYFSCSNFDGDNKNAVNVKNNEYINVKNWTRNGFDDNADIITLVEYNKKISFIEAVKFLHDILNIPLTYKKEIKKQEKFNPLAIFEKYRYNKIDVSEIHVLDEELLDDYIPLIYIDWYKEGVMPWAAKKFGLAYSYKKKRIVIPHRYWLDGSLLGFNMRTTVLNYEEFGISKYWITKGMNKSINVYGFWENHEEIKKAGYCVLYESEKSTIKRYSLNDKTGLSLSGKNISDEQVRIILSLNIKEIVLALDKDVNIDEIRYLCSKFYLRRNVSYIYDKWDLLKDKDSPADASEKIYQFLFEHRIKYDGSEHREYLKSLNKKQ